MAVEINTTFKITPEPKTVAGYQTALTALKEAGVPTDAAVTITVDGVISVTVADHTVRQAVNRFVKTLVGYPSPA